MFWPKIMIFGFLMPNLSNSMPNPSKFKMNACRRSRAKIFKEINSFRDLRCISTASHWRPGPKITILGFSMPNLSKQYEKPMEISNERLPEITSKNLQKISFLQSPELQSRALRKSILWTFLVFIFKKRSFKISNAFSYCFERCGIKNPKIIIFGPGLQCEAAETQSRALKNFNLWRYLLMIFGRRSFWISKGFSYCLASRIQKS